MKAAFIPAFGSPDSVSLGELPLRDPAPGEVVIRIAAAGVNPLDVKMIAGNMQPLFPVVLPWIPGTDFSGVVETLGAGISGLQPGDRVFGRSMPGAGGALARRLVMAADELCVIPAEMSFEQAASLPTTFGTSRQALFDTGRLQPGERVLIHAAAGGVGSMAVQQAHLAGAYVIATASGANIERVKRLGADEVIDYRQHDFTLLCDIDLVLDTLGGETLEKSWSVLRASGRIATVVEFGIEARNGFAGEFVFFASATPSLPEAIRQYQAGQLQIVIDTIFSLEDAPRALQKVATGHAHGKVLIRMTD